MSRSSVVSEAIRRSKSAISRDLHALNGWRIATGKCIRQDARMQRLCRGIVSEFERLVVLDPAKAGLYREGIRIVRDFPKVERAQLKQVA